MTWTDPAYAWAVRAIDRALLYPPVRPHAPAIITVITAKPANTQDTKRFFDEDGETRKASHKPKGTRKL